MPKSKNKGAELDKCILLANFEISSRHIEALNAYPQLYASSKIALLGFHSNMCEVKKSDELNQGLAYKERKALKADRSRIPKVV